MSQTPETGPNMNRRAFLQGASKIALGVVTTATIGTGDAVAKTLKKENKEVGIPQSFINQINAYESSDSPITGNPEKYRDIALPLIQDGLDKPENLRMLRYLIYRELKNGYEKGASSEYREYDAEKVWNDGDFFGDIGEAKEYIVKHNTTHSDTRLNGSINLDTSEKILRRVKKRLEGEEGEDIAFIMKDKNGINIFVYYENGKLKYLFPTTPGSSSTPTPPNLKVSSASQLANYFLDDEYKRKKDENGKYIETQEQAEERRRIAIQKGQEIGGPMPYSRRLNVQNKAGNWGYDEHNTHVGNVTENGGSHGCARQSILGAYLMFYGLKPGTLVYYRPKLRLP